MLFAKGKVFFSISDIALALKINFLNICNLSG